MVLVPLLAAPTLMLAATAAERRYGPAVAGTIGAAPVAIAVVVLGVGADGAALAASAGAHVIAQVAFALAFAAVVVRHGGPAGLFAGTIAFAAVSLLVETVPAPLATAAAGPALLLAPALLKRGQAPVREGGRSGGAVVGAVVVFVLVGASLVTAELAGPAAAGAIAAFPALSGTLALMIARTRGKHAAAEALGGLLRGLRGYLAFCVIVALAGGGPVVALALAVALLQSFLPRNSVRPGGFGSTAKPRLV